MFPCVIRLIQTLSLTSTLNLFSSAELFGLQVRLKSSTVNDSKSDFCEYLIVEFFTYFTFQRSLKHLHLWCIGIHNANSWNRKQCRQIRLKVKSATVYTNSKFIVIT